MPRAGLTRDIIIEAAGRLADEQGFDALTLAAVARLFAVRLPSLYAHLESSEDLKKGVALLALDRLADAAEAAVAGRAGRDALIALCAAHRDFARRHPGLFHAARHTLDAASAAQSGGMRLSRINQAMLRGYDLGPEDRVHATRLVGSFILGFSLLELAGSFDHSAPEAEFSLTRGLDGLDLLIRNWADAPSSEGKAD